MLTTVSVWYFSLVGLFTSSCVWDKRRRKRRRGCRRMRRRRRRRRRRRIRRST